MTARSTINASYGSFHGSHASTCILQAVQALLGALPLKEDFDEAAPVYSTLSQLISDTAMSQKLGSQLANILQVTQSSPNNYFEISSISIVIVVIIAGECGLSALKQS